MDLTEELIVTKAGYVTTVTLNAPARLNALSQPMIAGLGEIFASLRDDSSTRAVILTGAGRGFCAGAHLGGLAEEARARTRTTYPRFTPREVGLYKPVIVAVNGVCAGAGLHFITGSDIIIAADTATFLDPHTSNGQVSALEPIGLIRRVPMSPVLRMVILGSQERMSSERAYQLGMVTEVVPADRLLTRANELGEMAAAPSPAAVESSLRAIWESLDAPLGAAYEAGYRLIIEHRGHPDAEEGARAFMDKRPPAWTASPPRP